MSSFKPGDWVQCTYANGTKFVVQVVSETSVKEGGRVYPTTLDSDWIAWQPEPNEWCWFWSKSFPKPQLLPFRSYFKGSFYSTEYGVTIFNGELCECNYFDFCEPFTGQLPTFIKDQS